MPELRKDPVRNSWVIIATDQALKTTDFPINKNGVLVEGSQALCPFCPGNEAFTTPEISAYRRPGTEPNRSGWRVRTIPNKFSPFKLQGEFHLNHQGINTSNNGLGQHEVVIETPEHFLDFHQLSVEQITLVYRMLRERYRDLATDPRIKFIQIYKNRGIFAGASQTHSHSQVLALPMVPDQFRGIGEYYQETGKCLICSILEQELSEQHRIIYESPSFILLCPYAARFSWETWIVPRGHQEHFGDMNDQQIDELAAIMKDFMSVLLTNLNDPSYNIIINSAPINGPESRGYHWFMEINPRLMVQNGLETSCNFYINPVSPELAATILGEKFLSQYKLP
ncbi:MAG TPA: galactose-1-phosphate uridylyltransferase [Syntrophomonadaceae bacterium]|nr:galactose-1-phosphate uridylyltransferase [Syntrophomonadaceae bacterium]